MTPATVLAHWPGKSIAACNAHATHACTIANAMGFTLTVTPLAETLCLPCAVCEQQREREVA